MILKLKNMIQIFGLTLIILFMNLCDIKAIDQNIGFESMHGDAIGEILQYIPHSGIFNVTQDNIEQFKKIALLRKDKLGKAQWGKRAFEILKILKDSTWDFLDNFKDKPDIFIRDAIELNTEFSQLYLKKLINTDFKTYDLEIAKKVNEIFCKAIKEGQIETVKFLVKAGVDLNIAVDFEDTALIFASRRGFKNIIKFLLKKGANPNISNAVKNTLLIIATLKEKDIVELLLNSNKTDPNMQDLLGNTALIWAVKWNDKAIVELLINNNKTNLNIQNCWGNTALIEAVRKNNKDIVELLLKNNKTNIFIKNSAGQTALSFVTDEYKKDIATLFDADVKSSNWRSSNIVASVWDRKSIIEILLKAEAKENEKLSWCQLI